MCRLTIAPESQWVTDHDMSGFGVECRAYTHEEIVAFNWHDLRALLKLSSILLPF